ncbi:RNA-directed DNA polymerase, eukaryota, reverse transcriptase zinc-binding domain protein [Tanacetum coccineum]
MIVAVYAPHDPRDKRMLWDYLAHVINQWQGEVVIMGDFNEVRVKSDRFGTNFNVLRGDILILLLFHGSLKKFILEITKSETVSTIANLKKELNQLDAVIDKGTCTEVEAEKRMEVLAALRNIDHIHSMDLAQKAKIKWSIEGDENSKIDELNLRRGVPNIDMRFFTKKTISEIKVRTSARVLFNRSIQAGCIVRMFFLMSTFYYLGSRGRFYDTCSSMERDSWKKVAVSSFPNGIQNLLSIGGRLTLLKSVLGSIPVFHMSIFKVPSKVLHILESIRSHFFNGHDPGSKKASWVKWNNVLTDKKRGGLVIVAIHGVGGNIPFGEWTLPAISCWLSIYDAPERLPPLFPLQRKGCTFLYYLTHRWETGSPPNSGWIIGILGAFLKTFFPDYTRLNPQRMLLQDDRMELESGEYGYIFGDLSLLESIDGLCLPNIWEKN